jgi:transposase
MLRMLDRHAVQELLRAGVRPRQVAQQMGVSRRTVERIAREATVTVADDRAARAVRRLGRPQVEPTIRATVRRLVEEDPAIPPGEVCRRLREAGTPRGLSTTYRVIAQTRQEIPAEVMVRFEGVAGEFAQFDFGHVEVRLTDGARRRVHFAAYRLEWSRWVHVVLVPNERVEALVRALLASFAASGGVPLRVVFDNPKTVVLRREEGRPTPLTGAVRASSPCPRPRPARRSPGGTRRAGGPSAPHGGRRGASAGAARGVPWRRP